jgi:hypothetical protein
LPNVHGKIAKILANASASKHPDFYGTSDINLGYALIMDHYSKSIMQFGKALFKALS